MQGTTADLGLVAYWFFPQRCSDTVRWLNVYVMLSRPRFLATPKSVNPTKQIRDIIEQGPPEDLVANIDKLFHDKIEETRELARQAAREHGLLSEFFRATTAVLQSLCPPGAIRPWGCTSAPLMASACGFRSRSVTARGF